MKNARNRSDQSSDYHRLVVLADTTVRLRIRWQVVQTTVSTGAGYVGVERWMLALFLGSLFSLTAACPLIVDCYLMVDIWGKKECLTQ